MFGFLLLLLIFIFPPQVHAIYDPLSVPNNRYGIHIVDTNDLPDLSALVNTTGGDWGYVTMVLSDSERDHDRWQNIFNEMRRLHMIPIVRLATHIENGNWAKPQKDRFYEVVKLLNSLNWPTENRYVILYNEPNHANEWGGTIDPSDYAATFVQFAKELKAASSDFFILPAGLDASSADDEASFITQMIASKPEMLTLMDGWTSHSYPNPGFSGSPYARGRGTLSTFDWELSFLSSLGLTKTLPVFITETGWEHEEGKVTVPGLLSSDQVAANMLVAASSVWQDPRIVAITPFIYNYQDVPFDHFSWKQLGGGGFYSEYPAYQSIRKIKGTPIQRESYALQSDLLPAKLIAGSTYALSAMIENDGQGILSEGDGYTVSLTSGNSPVNIFVDPLPYLEPGDKGQLMIHIKTPIRTGELPVTLTLNHNSSNILLQMRTITIVPPPSVTVTAKLGWRSINNASDVSVLIYDKDTLVQKFTGLTIVDGKVTANTLLNIIPGESYRVVTLVHGYLPRQVITVLGAGNTEIRPNRFLPLDFNGDGTFTFADIETLIQMQPWTAVLRFFGP